MDDNLVRQVTAHPSYQALKSRRNALGLWLTVAMLVVFYGFILLVAFNKPLLATRIGEGVTTLGMPIGLAVIVFTVVITVFYVRRANSDFDRLAAEVQASVAKKGGRS
ncbi:MAG: DUF485 domain-containing protein [Rubrivivax sp.]|jgi:uncharacterized membrane protein (DUF485 family)|nr:DUF485 domain-containing protein [Rubrivivax sp.]